MLEQKGEGSVYVSRRVDIRRRIDRLGINKVIVVEDEDKIVRDGSDFIEQGCQNRFGWRWLRGLQNSQHPFSNIRRYRL